ncbi:hypothetical protein L210DRAFT_3545979 [Boletus edulis BED1]|uniref:AB hydrolase-1 domain-containing protein n=1 Tax=Boletus edulis BED1 TaxID=1328754 RepID=A0AAD4BQE0_BOLED|nr:hypothetical protein L210DRAFT_3545979 [Boletus edulis BED1]
MPSPAVFKSLRVFDFDYTYLDSGPPASSDYTTWVFVHGLGFNGATLEKLLPLAHAHNLRIVSLYRRGYSPSSGFRDDELAGIGPQKKIDEAEPFFRAQGSEIAMFLVRFATDQCIPMANPSSPNTGGITLIGWSLGGIHVLALLAYLDELPEDTQSTLQKYLHTILSHDASAHALGIPNPSEHGISLWFEADDRKRFDGFFDGITAHFIHKSVTSENIDDLEFNNPSQEIPHSLCDLSYAQRAEYTDLRPFSYAGCDGKLLLCDLTAFAALTKRALFDKARAAKWPNVRVRYMSSGTSPGVLVWALWMLRKYAEKGPPPALYGSDAEKARDIKFIAQTEGNHFIFWEDPEKAIQQFSVAINL